MIAVLGSITSGDQHVLRWIVDHRVAVLNPLFEAITYLAVGGTVWIVIAVVVAWRTRRPIVPAAVFAAVVIWGADAIANGLKALTNRPRPYVAMKHLHVLIARPSSTAFPSGHATTAFAGAAVSSFLWPRGAPIFFVGATLVAFSRLYLGVHYPTDVVAGAVIGVLFAGAGIAVVARTSLRERLEPRGEGHTWF